MDPILLRVKKFSEFKKLSLRQFGFSIGRSGAYLSNSIKAGSTPSADLISKICEIYPDLNVRWLLTGQGKMLLDVQLDSKTTLKNENTLTIDELVDQKIEEKFRDIKEVLAELVANEIEKEIEQTRNEMKKAPKP